MFKFPELALVIVVSLACPNSIPVNCGEALVWISCGVESVILPPPFVTVIWLEVPVRVATVGSVLPSPIKSCPLDKTPVAVIALVPLPSRTPPSVNVVAPVPPLATESIPVVFAMAIVPPLVAPEWACCAFVKPVPEIVGVTIVGLALNTKLVLAVPVVPVAALR